MNLAGGLEIVLTRSDDGRTEAQIASNRPVDLARLFVARTTEELQTSLPRLFSLCGMAQARAVQRVCAAALGAELDEAIERARDRLVEAEMLREHGLRVLVGWSKVMGASFSPFAARRLTGLPEEMRQALFGNSEPFGATARFNDGERIVGSLLAEVRTSLEQEIFGEDLDIFLSRDDVGQLKLWAADGETPAKALIHGVLARGWSAEGAGKVEPLPRQTDDAWLAPAFAAKTVEHFVAQPDVDGAPRETSALTRQAETPLIANIIAHHGTGLLARLTARLLELAHCRNGCRSPMAVKRLLQHLRRPCRMEWPLPKLKRRAGA
jgi:hypothetical protein